MHGKRGLSQRVTFVLDGTVPFYVVIAKPPKAAEAISATGSSTFRLRHAKNLVDGGMPGRHRERLEAKRQFWARAKLPFGQ